METYQALILLIIVAASPLILVSSKPIMDKLDSLRLEAKKKVEARHNRSKEFYYVYEVVRRKFYNAVLTLCVLFSDSFLLLGVFVFTDSPNHQLGGFIAYTSFFLFLLLFMPIYAYMVEMRKDIPVLAVTEDCLEHWNVKSTDVRYVKQIKWPEIDRVDLILHSYSGGELIIDIPIEIAVRLMRIPNNYYIVLYSGPWRLVLDARWPNGMRLLEDTLRLDPKAKGWDDLELMRKEIEKWKGEAI